MNKAWKAHGREWFSTRSSGILYDNGKFNYSTSSRGSRKTLNGKIKENKQGGKINYLSTLKLYKNE